MDCGREESLLFLRGLFWLLQTGVASGLELRTEFLDSSGGVYELQLAGVERVASVANIDFQFRSRTARHKCIPTTASYRCFEILWVDTFFHRPVL